MCCDWSYWSVKETGYYSLDGTKICLRCRRNVDHHCKLVFLLLCVYVCVYPKCVCIQNVCVPKMCREGGASISKATRNCNTFDDRIPTRKATLNFSFVHPTMSDWKSLLDVHQDEMFKIIREQSGTVTISKDGVDFNFCATRQEDSSTLMTITISLGSHHLAFSVALKRSDTFDMRSLSDALQSL